MGNIITVSREFGSGGRELGKRLADELGYRYYDREIVTALSEQTGMDPNFLDHQLESSSARVRYPIHFLFCDFGGTNIHAFIHLHRISGDNLSANLLSQSYGSLCFSNCGGTRNDNQRFLFF